MAKLTSVPKKELSKGNNVQPKTEYESATSSSSTSDPPPKARVKRILEKTKVAKWAKKMKQMKAEIVSVKAIVNGGYKGSKVTLENCVITHVQDKSPHPVYELSLSDFEDEGQVPSTVYLQLWTNQFSQYGLKEAPFESSEKEIHTVDINNAVVSQYESKWQLKCFRGSTVLVFNSFPVEE